MKVKTRFAPSPTGNLHIGSVRTALYSWLFAKHHNGKFVLRIEDTDFQRSQECSIDSILDGLSWLGLNWDEGPYFQTKRLNRYKAVIKTMLKNNHAYKCFCSPEAIEEERKNQIKKGLKPRYSRICRNLRIKNTFHQDYVVRFKNPIFGKVVFIDQIRGKITFNNSELDDLIIQRSNGIPTYNFCVVIDDLDMKITHVIRGEDHINNTPRQINILKSLDAKIPIYAHLSMVLDENGSKISKRKEAKNIIEYRENGFLPEALLNYIVRLGWSFGNQEIFTITEMIKLFNLNFVSKSSCSINIKKLFWMNKYYINSLPLNQITSIMKEQMKRRKINIKKGPDLDYLVKLFRNRFNTIKDMADSFLYFYQEFETYNDNNKEKYLISQNSFILKRVYAEMEKLSTWDISSISKVIDFLSIKFKIEKIKINMILRLVITGYLNSPSISLIIYLIGKKKTLSRIFKAINYVKNL